MGLLLRTYAFKESIYLLFSNVKCLNNSAMNMLFI